ncbi:MAG TPA: ATP-dependent helicase [Oligoflexia bacterium]|nr:ATP-dependent helicase [Oligoflexia bacterium]
MKEYVLHSTTEHPARKFTINYQTELNEAQLKAVQSIYGPQLVIAGAGSGKTRTLIYRVAYLIEHDIRPEAILLLTFTKKAAQEMMRRASALLDERCSRIRGGTFHAFANLTLRRYGALLGYNMNFTIIDRSDAEDMIDLLRSELGGIAKDKRFPKKATIHEVISKAVNTGRSHEQILSDEYPQFLCFADKFQELAAKFQQDKIRRSVMDYDDLLVNHKRLLSEHPELRRKLSLESEFIMIDEFQDTNKIQAEIGLLLASEHKNILAVGDDSQSIYSFRGAEFRNIMDFPNYFENCAITTLEQNYRSTQPILEFTNKIIESAKEKYSKVLFSDIPASNRPVFLRPQSFYEQADFICQRVLELREDGVVLDDMAVLFRAGWHSNELEVALNSANIPFVKFGGLKFIESAHVKDSLALLRVIQNPHDGIAWYRLLLLHEGIGPKTARTLAERIVQPEQGLGTLIDAQIVKKSYGEALGSLHKLVDSLCGSSLAPSDIAEEAMQYYRKLLSENYDDYRKREDDLVSLARMAGRYSSLKDFLDDLTLAPLEHSQVGAESTDLDEEKFVLSTIHSAKGLEWHSVFLISLIDGFLPSAKSLRTPAEIEEERRLFYVACTRAKRNLYLLCPELHYSRSYSWSTDGFAFSEPSRFLRDVESFEDLVEQWSLTSI